MMNEANATHAGDAVPARLMVGVWHENIRTPPTITLALLSLGLFAATGPLIRGVDAIGSIRAPDGEVMRTPDGRMLMERDPLGQFLVNWDAYVCILGGFVLSAWAVARVCLPCANMFIRRVRPRQTIDQSWRNTSTRLIIGPLAGLPCGPQSVGTVNSPVKQ